jgi:hypothetical protein
MWNGKTVVMDLHGGLGNQLFQLAFGIHLAQRENLALEWTWRGDPLRDFSLEPFGFARPEPWAPPRTWESKGQGNSMSVLLAAESVASSRHPLCGIKGLFENEDCFLPAADRVRELFQIKPAKLPKGKGTPVAIQVRRTDFLLSRVNVVCTQTYFRNAIDHMLTLIPDAQFHIVSDDVGWCAKAFSRVEGATMWGGTALEDFQVLKACKAHIISNSTFGWWGAWLGEKGPVLVPEIWKQHPYTHFNVAPERWVRVAI